MRLPCCTSSNAVAKRSGALIIGKANLSEWANFAQDAINDTLAAKHLDAIIAPTNGPTWVTDPVNGDDFSTFVGSSSPSAIAGYVSITVPAGYAGPLPIGVTFIGGRWDEPTLIGLAYDFEQATHVRVAPTFIPSIGPDAAARGPVSNAEKWPAVPGRNGTWRMLPLR
jgi:Asp-tRNA(Asn)/Glu-tRNA(Gln) amidotransferase A subunit family amidase